MSPGQRGLIEYGISMLLIFSKAVATSETEYPVPRLYHYFNLALNSLKCCNVTTSNIRNVNAVTHTCTIVSIAVITEDSKLLTDTHGSLKYMEVVKNSVRILTNQTVLANTDRIEITKKNNIQPLYVF